MKRHILVVDDEPAILYTVVFVLRKAGYQVSQAKDGEEALALVLETQKKQEHFDLIVTDIKMPKMSGTQLLNEVKRNQIFIPALVVSGIKSGNVNKILNNGSTDFLMKPFDLRELIRRVEAILERTDKGQKRDFSLTSNDRRVSTLC
jgi:DNA-binding response OmpR family regulator